MPPACTLASLRAATETRTTRRTLYALFVSYGFVNALTGSQNNTALRGIQQTDADGIVQFLTVFTGHYTGRAPHTHFIANSNGTVFSNGTFTAATTKHVGQLFYDQDLIAAVEQSEPYASNTQPLTLNTDDSILAEEADVIDPFVQYVYLGDSAADGIFGWIAFGINVTEASAVRAAANYTEAGGVTNPNSGGGGPGGPPSGSLPLPTSTSV
jgi:hypothetical protein